jgi:hypothetical protein
MVISIKVPNVGFMVLQVPKMLGYLCNFGARRTILHLVKLALLGAVVHFLGGHLSAVSLNEVSASEI